jgi:hypothetical protein
MLRTHAALMGWLSPYRTPWWWQKVNGTNNATYEFNKRPQRAGHVLISVNVDLVGPKICGLQASLFSSTTIYPLSGYSLCF